MNIALALSATLLLAGTRLDDEKVLENDHVRVTVDPRAGGAITGMTFKHATVFPVIAERGAGVAGTGTLFVPRIDGTDIGTNSPAVSMKSLEGETVLEVTCPAGDGLTLTRTIRMAKEESGFRITDVYHNRGRSDAKIRVGCRSLQRPEPWRLTLGSWFGDGRRSWRRDIPFAAGDATRKRIESSRLFWRLSGQYGVGFHYASSLPGGRAELLHELPKERGHPVRFRWDSDALPLAAGSSLTVESGVLIDEGGRADSDPETQAGDGRILVTVDLRSGGRRGESMPALVTAVSAIPTEAKLVLEAYTREGDTVLNRWRLKDQDLTLKPGKARLIPFDVTPTLKGLLYVRAVLQDASGATLASGRDRAVIEGENATGELGTIWKTYVRKIPNAVYKGTWAQIGAQLAKAGRLKARSASPGARERLAFYEKRFPYYAELVRGAAKELGARPETISQAPTPAAPSEACMNVFFNGPDGPINAFSKERSGSGLRGLGYMKVLPDRGYAYHVYECGRWQNGYGVNSKGLSTSGASINCDGRTNSQGQEETRKWKSSGRRVAPLGMHLMLATCRNVDEAIRFIRNPEAPFEFTGNMLLVDREGNAARLESVGIRRQIHRYDPERKAFFVVGNYPHETKEGLFKIGANWGWAANTMLRERLLWDLAGARTGGVTLKDAFWLMETHAAGGMCQHVCENPGRLMTSTSYIAVCRTGDLWLAHGPPCRVRYYRFTLEDASR